MNPVPYPPGSYEKVQAMVERHALGQPLFHPLDGQVSGDIPRPVSWQACPLYRARRRMDYRGWTCLIYRKKRLYVNLDRIETLQEFLRLRRQAYQAAVARGVRILRYEGKESNHVQPTRNSSPKRRRRAV